MSHRTLPVYDYRVDGQRMLELRFGKRLCSSASAPQLPCIFTALENACLADVRRAVAANRHVLLAAEIPAHLRFHPRRLQHEPDCTPYMPPIDYLLHLVSTWSAILAHCDRSGAIVATLSVLNRSLTLREGLAVLSQTGIWLLSQEGNPRPRDDALHIAIKSKLPALACAICQRHPELAFARLLPCLKAPIHTLAATAAGCASQADCDFVRVAKVLLKVPGVSASAVDTQLRNALHDLVLSCSAAPPYGLSRTRKRVSSLHALRPLIEILVANGADPCGRDKYKQSPLSLAASSLDYHVIVSAANKIYDDMVHCSWPTESTSRPTRDVLAVGDRRHSLSGCDAGLFSELPTDILLLLFKYLTPKEALLGLGSTCRLLRELSTNEFLWVHLSTQCTIQHVRDVFRDSIASGQNTAPQNMTM